MPEVPPQQHHPCVQEITKTSNTRRLNFKRDHDRTHSPLDAQFFQSINSIDNKIQIKKYIDLKYQRRNQYYSFAFIILKSNELITD